MEDKYIHIKISEKLKKELKREANSMELTLNSYIRIILMNRKVPCNTKQE